MFDVRITELATGRKTNFFGVDEQWITTMDGYLNSDLFEMVVWAVPIDDYGDHHVDCANAVACVCPS